MTCERIRTIVENTAAAMECKCEVDLNDYYPAVVNPEKETAHVKRLASSLFGPQHLSEEELPISASEDFSYYLQERPGCFWTLGTLKPGMTPKTLHTSDFDFNDDMIATAGWFYIKLVEDRLKVSIL